MPKKKATGGRAGQTSDRPKKSGANRTGSESNASKGNRGSTTRKRQPENGGKQAGSGKNDPDSVPMSGGRRAGRTPESGRNRTR